MSNGILLQSGKFYSFDNPEQNEFDIEDAANSLSNICRYGGSVGKFYSVAQHSVYVSLCSTKFDNPQNGNDEMEKLLHDISEFVLGDIPTPLKHMLKDYQAIEATHEQAIFGKFGLEYPMPLSVKIADRMVLLAEIRDIKPKHDYWEPLMTVEPFDMKIEPWPPELAKAMFLKRYNDILAKRTIN